MNNTMRLKENAFLTDLDLSKTPSHMVTPILVKGSRQSGQQRLHNSSEHKQEAMTPLKMNHRVSFVDSDAGMSFNSRAGGRNFSV